MRVCMASVLDILARLYVAKYPASIEALTHLTFLCRPTHAKPYTTIRSLQIVSTIDTRRPIRYYFNIISHPFYPQPDSTPPSPYSKPYSHSHSHSHSHPPHKSTTASSPTLPKAKRLYLQHHHLFIHSFIRTPSFIPF